MRQQRRGIAGGAADIEHAVGLGNVGGLDQLGQHHRLEQAADRLPRLAHRHVEVEIGERRLVARGKTAPAAARAWRPAGADRSRRRCGPGRRPSCGARRQSRSCVVPDDAEGATFAARPVKRQASARGWRRVVERRHVLYSGAGATWRSGDAADCKSAYPGSIPGVASNLRICASAANFIAGPPKQAGICLALQRR